jgi:hypothetical protein
MIVSSKGDVVTATAPMATNFPFVFEGRDGTVYLRRRTGKDVTLWPSSRVGQETYRATDDAAAWARRLRVPVSLGNSA